MQPLIFKAIETFVVCNIPTLLFIIIAVVIHQKQKRKIQMDKMNIQDL